MFVVGGPKRGDENGDEAERIQRDEHAERFAKAHGPNIVPIGMPEGEDAASSLVDSSAPRVLVIDDDRMMQMLLRRNLTQAGYDVDSASEGTDGLKKLRSAPFDLVILDFMMPGMDGYEVLAQIKADESVRDVPVVVVSGIDDRANAALLVEAGAADYLTKPVDAGLLRARAARCIDTKRAREREQRLLAEVRASYAQLRESEKARDQLTHMIVHDLRTPLTSLLGSLRLLASGKLPDDGRAEMVDLAVQTGTQMSGMIDELLERHRLESGGSPLQLAATDAIRVARGALDKVRGLADTQGVAIAIEGAPCEARLDAAKIDRVLVNLLGNAIKVSRHGTSIKLSVGGEAEEIRFSVEDEGPGVAESEREKIFEPFYSGVASAASNLPSTGLGLAFCKLAVETHGGRIWVESREPAGSRFIVSLPR
jgi:signal transduction histidine kinase